MFDLVVTFFLAQKPNLCARATREGPLRATQIVTGFDT